MSRVLGRVLVCAFMGLVMIAIFGVRPSPIIHAAEDPVVQDAQQTILEGRRTFRFDTFGDQQFWGDTLHLHEAVEGADVEAAAFASQSSHASSWEESSR